MNRLMGRGVLACVVLTGVVLGTLSGCGDEVNPNLATPTSTVQTYLSIADRLAGAKEIDLGGVRDGVQCFSKADRQWFKNNFKTYPLDELTGNASMAISEPAIRQAFVFMYGVVPRGPRGDGKALQVVTETATDATVKIDNDVTIPLIKEGPNWRINGLFGAKTE